MNMLTVDTLTAVTDQIDPYFILHPASAAYVALLVKPYVEVLETATIEGMREWLPSAFPEKLGIEALLTMNTLVNAKITDYNNAAFEAKGVELLEEEQYNTTVPEVIATAREIIIDYLISEIIENGGYNARDINDNNIYPWDIQYGIANNENLSKMFGISKEMNKLPVDVIIGTQKFTHEFTHEFTHGLLLFNDIGNGDFIISIFNVPFNLVTEDDRFILNQERTYGVTIGDHRYWFNTPDFMQGFTTGAMWKKVDHHVYWKELTKYDHEKGTEELITF